MRRMETGAASTKRLQRQCPNSCSSNTKNNSNSCSSEDEEVTQCLNDDHDDEDDDEMVDIETTEDEVNGLLPQPDEQHMLSVINNNNNNINSMNNNTGSDTSAFDAYHQHYQHSHLLHLQHNQQELFVKASPRPSLASPSIDKSEAAGEQRQPAGIINSGGTVDEVDEESDVNVVDSGDTGDDHNNADDDAGVQNENDDDIDDVNDNDDDNGGGEMMLPAEMMLKRVKREVSGRFVIFEWACGTIRHGNVCGATVGQTI